MAKERKGYPSDVSDEEWEFCAPYLTLMKEDAPQRIPQGVSETPLERLHRHPRLNRRDALDVDDAGFQQ